MYMFPCTFLLYLLHYHLWSHVQKSKNRTRTVLASWSRPSALARLIARASADVTSVTVLFTVALELTLWSKSVETTTYVHIGACLCNKTVVL